VKVVNLEIGYFIKLPVKMLTQYLKFTNTFVIWFRFGVGFENLFDSANVLLMLLIMCDVFY
jgi:hypothetical protein